MDNLKDMISNRQGWAEEAACRVLSWRTLVNWLFSGFSFALDNHQSGSGIHGSAKMILILLARDLKIEMCEEPGDCEEVLRKLEAKGFIRMTTGTGCAQAGRRSGMRDVLKKRLQPSSPEWQL